MSFIRITWYLLTTKYNIALSRLEYPPFALTRVIPLPNVSVNALHISCGHSVTIIAHFALSCSVDTFYNKVNRLQCCGIRNDRIQWKHPALKYTSTDNISINPFDNPPHPANKSIAFIYLLSSVSFSCLNSQISEISQSKLEHIFISTSMLTT